MPAPPTVPFWRGRAGASSDLCTRVTPAGRSKARLSSSSLPMSRAAVLLGRTTSDIPLNVLSLVVLFAVGFAAGFNFQDTTAGQVVLGIVLLLPLLIVLIIIMGATVHIVTHRSR